MALIKYAAIVSEARGKESGIIFSRNKYGAYIKAKISPVNPQTPYQQAQRIALGSFSQQWSGLSEDEKDNWNSLGQQIVRVNRFGDQTNYSGFNLFVKCNRNLGLIVEPAIEEAPSVPAIPALTLTVLTMEETGDDGTTMTLAFTAIGGEAIAGFKIALEATPPILTGRRFVKNFYRNIGSFVGETSPMNFLAAYQARFGVKLVLGNFVSVRARMIGEDSGLDGAVSVISGLVVAAA